MARRLLHDCRALVTGASSGIGRALVLELAGRGCRVVAVARRGDALEELAQQAAQAAGQVETVCGDVTDSAVRQAALNRAAEAFGGLDLLINNAGVGALGPFAEAAGSRLRRIMEVNFFAAAELTREAVPHLHRGRQPMVVLVGSVLGMRGVPNSAEYCASKFALHGLSQSLRAEFARRQPVIDVLYVAPSTTETEFFDALLERRAETAWKRRPRMAPRTVARRMARAIESGKHELVLSVGGKLLVSFSHWTPRLMDWIVARWF